MTAVLRAPAALRRGTAVRVAPLADAADQSAAGLHVATLDVDGDGVPVATWYGGVRPEHLADVRLGELDRQWFDGNPEYRSAAGPVDLDEDPYIGLTDMWNGTPQRDEWGRVGCYAWAVDRLMEAA